MAEIRTFPAVKHLRSEPTFYTLHYKKGKLNREGRGLAFWFRDLASSVVEVPLDDKELQFIFHGRTLDFQDISVQGVITYHVTDPKIIADRIDFTIDLDTGNYTKTPLEQVGGLLSQLAQQFVLDYLAKNILTSIFKEGIAEIRTRVQDGLAAEKRLTEMGIEIVAVRVSAIKPSSDVERALQTPTRESIQQQADEATFSRRALAVEKERAIEENELQNQIEIAKRKELLVAQQGKNARLTAEESEQAKKIVALGQAERDKLITTSEVERVGLIAEAEAKKKQRLAEVQANEVEMVEGARVKLEKEQIEIYADLDQATLLGLAAKELAGKLEHIEHLNISPDMLSPLLASLMAAKTKDIKES